jgi:DNA-binding XRE family transcriptional regulator
VEKKLIGERLRELRGDISREQLAVALGVTSQAIFNYETGARIPSDEMKIKIANYFNRTVQEIFFSD